MTNSCLTNSLRGLLSGNITRKTINHNVHFWRKADR